MFVGIGEGVSVGVGVKVGVEVGVWVDVPVKVGVDVFAGMGVKVSVGIGKGGGSSSWEEMNPRMRASKMRRKSHQYFLSIRKHSTLIKNRFLLAVLCLCKGIGDLLLVGAEVRERR